MAIKVKVNIDNMMSRGFEALRKEIDIRVTRAFQMACKEAVTFAKQNHEYTQQTGALNSSTGFQLYKDGTLIDDYFEIGGGDGTGHGDGINAGKKVAAERALQLGAHICAVIVAGMPYAIYVESKGYDVLTGAEKQFPAILDRFMNEVFNDTGMSYSIT
ncbi:MAG: hypothetical protein LBS01_01075 [Prevotellaceae bacterium]|jgi:hypothetical protein|nr:hypothetical protein [Prevotellaceae bacterium]